MVYSWVLLTIVVKARSTPFQHCWFSVNMIKLTLQSGMFVGTNKFDRFDRALQ